MACCLVSVCAILSRSVDAMLIKEDHIQTRLGMGWEASMASMGVRSTGGILFMNSFFTSMTSR